jgi:hypothetical protein
MLVLNLLFYVLINSYFFKVANIEFFSQNNGVKQKYLVFYAVKWLYLGFLQPKNLIPRKYNTKWDNGRKHQWSCPLYSYRLSDSYSAEYGLCGKTSDAGCMKFQGRCPIPQKRLLALRSSSDGYMKQAYH